MSLEIVFESALLMAALPKMWQDISISCRHDLHEICVDIFLYKRLNIVSHREDFLNHWKRNIVPRVFFLIFWSKFFICRLLEFYVKVLQLFIDDTFSWWYTKSSTSTPLTSNFNYLLKSTTDNSTWVRQSGEVSNHSKCHSWLM